MRLPIAIAGSIVHFLVAPVVVAGVIPYWLTDWRLEQRTSLAMIGGVVLAAACVAVLVVCFLLFVRDGRGTPAPMAPTEKLVVRGPYRFVRNPMYLSVVGIIIGQGMFFEQARLFLYGAIAALVMAAFAHGYEEPALRAAFGVRYEIYSQHVAAWRPRLRPSRDTEGKANGM